MNSPKKGLILVVDDNQDSRDIVKRILIREQLTTIEARDGQEGIEICFEESPDLILMDIRMPRLNGDQATRIIRDSLGDECPPIIGLTGDLLEIKGSSRKHDVFDEVLGKPYEFETLTNIVKRHLAKVA
ncbi:MAG: response regulator [Verrucomicrobiota bacterium]